MFASIKGLLCLEVDLDLAYKVVDVVDLVFDLLLHLADVISDLVDAQFVQVSEF